MESTTTGDRGDCTVASDVGSNQGMGPVNRIAKGGIYCSTRSCQVLDEATVRVRGRICNREASLHRANPGGHPRLVHRNYVQMRQSIYIIEYPALARGAQTKNTQAQCTATARNHNSQQQHVQACAIPPDKLLQGAGMHCNTLQCAAVRCDALRCAALRGDALQCGALRCNAVRCAALRCDALRCAARRCAGCDALRCAALRCDALRCAALRCAAMRCAALRCDAL